MVESFEIGKNLSSKEFDEVHLTMYMDFCQIKEFLNSRPLTSFYVNLNDLTPLTLKDFLVGDSLTAFSTFK